MARKKKAQPKRKRVRDSSTVRTSPYYQEIKDCFGSGWSAPKVRAYLIEQYGEDGVPGEKALQRWRSRYMPEASVVPSNIIEDKLRGLDYKVDVIGHLSRLVAMLEDRMLRSIRMEYTVGEAPLEITDAARASYLAALQEYTDVARSLGIMKAPLPPMFDMRTQTLNVNVPPEILGDFNATLKEINRHRLGEG